MSAFSVTNVRIFDGEEVVDADTVTCAGGVITRVGHGPSAGTEVIDGGGGTLLPGLIDAHVHLFLHPGAEDLQTVEESVPKRTILAALYMTPFPPSSTDLPRKPVAGSNIELTTAGMAESATDPGRHHAGSGAWRAGPWSGTRGADVEARRKGLCAGGSRGL